MLVACSNKLSSEVVDGDGREDVSECNAASAHIHQCCPNAMSLPDCNYSRTDYYCGSWPNKSLVGSSVTDQPIPEGQSESIRNESCAALEADGTCGKDWPPNATPPTEPGTSDQECGPCGC